jgi:chromosome segregation ATPase
MITLSPPPSMPSPDAAFGHIAELVALLADPAATQKRVLELRAAAKEYREAAAAHGKAKADLERAQGEHAGALAAARKTHAEQLAEERRTFEAEIVQRQERLAERERDVDHLRGQVAAELEVLTAQRQALDEKLSALKADTEQRQALLKTLAA